ncbi:hypothetical protein [Curtobacterium pusillum]|uniref:Uncharacterized protein n=1 Tax=Curtobacterium pusillum TaxID=69373 RepID=A0ABX2MAE8_9MICO|nr:hypothetical protein [Curtobacterium pusillum]NUU15015.1 hypothetical protein [Curtobacterium pusillum]
MIAESSLGRAEFAAAIGIDSTKPSKSLSGRRRFSSLELARVAHVGRRSVDWLITGRAFVPPGVRRREAAEYLELAQSAGETRPGWPLVSAHLDAYRAGEITAKLIAKLLDWSVADVEESFAVDDPGAPSDELGTYER